MVELLNSGRKGRRHLLTALFLSIAAVAGSAVADQGAPELLLPERVALQVVRMLEAMETEERRDYVEGMTPRRRGNLMRSLEMAGPDGEELRAEIRAFEREVRTPSPPPTQGPYLFSVPRAEMDVHVSPDASVRIAYEIVFSNAERARYLDVVDVGLPSEDFDGGGIRAWIEAHELHAIGPSPYVSPGVAVSLGEHSIPRGQRGVFRFEARIANAVYQDISRRGDAILQITPTWFGGDFVRGMTNLTVAIHLPPGISPDELRWSQAPYREVSEEAEGTLTATWRWPGTELTGPHLVGISFPKSVMDHVVADSIPRAGIRSLLGLLGSHGFVLLVLGLLLVLPLFAYHLPQPTWSALWVSIGIVGVIVLGIATYPGLRLGDDFVNVEAIVGAGVVFVLGGVLMAGWISRHRRLQRYLPPIVSVEGGGVKRGLTAPEAAALLERPVEQVVTLVVIGLVRKGVLEVSREEPLVVEVNPPYDGTRDERLAAAAKASVVLHGYEHPFIDALLDAKEKEKEKDEATEDEEVVEAPSLGWIDLHGAFDALLKSVVERMAGYDVEETRDHYRHVIERAWKQAEEIGDLDAIAPAIASRYEWMVLADEGPERYRALWRGQGIPATIIPEIPLSHPAGAAPGAHAPSAPRIRDVAGAFATWSEDLATSAGNWALPELYGKAEPPCPNGGSSGFSGGGCACAGCACACACAGGGR